MSSFRYKVGDNVLITFISNDPPDFGYTEKIEGYGPMWDFNRGIIDLDGGGNINSFTSRVHQDTLTIPDGITFIREGMFGDIGSIYGYGSVRCIIIGENVEEIGQGAFGCAYDVSDGNLSYLPHGRGATYSIILKGNKVRKLGESCFMGQTEIQDLDFHGSVEEIGVYCFCGCHNVQRLNLADDWIFTNHSYYGDYGYRAFWKCLNLWRISENNTICSILQNPIVNGERLPSLQNYYGCERLQSITVRNNIDNFQTDPSIEDPSLFVRLNHGSVLDEDGYFITEIETPFDQVWDLDFRGLNNRVLIPKSDFSVYVYHLGRIIRLSGGNSGNIPVAHEGQWKYLNAVQDSENTEYSPIHFTHKGHWYQFKY